MRWTNKRQKVSNLNRVKQFTQIDITIYQVTASSQPLSVFISYEQVCLFLAFITSFIGVLFSFGFFSRKKNFFNQFDQLKYFAWAKKVSLHTWWTGKIGATFIWAFRTWHNNQWFDDNHIRDRVKKLWMSDDASLTFSASFQRFALLCNFIVKKRICVRNWIHE